jgi:hypothetical protein
MMSGKHDLERVSVLETPSTKSALLLFDRTASRKRASELESAATHGNQAMTYGVT